LLDPTLCNLINHNGILKYTRQPGVTQLTSQKIVIPIV